MSEKVCKFCPDHDEPSRKSRRTSSRKCSPKKKIQKHKVLTTKKSAASKQKDLKKDVIKIKLLKGNKVKMGRKSYNEEDLKTAYALVKTEGFSLSKAATLCGVPRSTLNDRISGRISMGARQGPSPLLNREDEKQLFEYIDQMVSLGYTFTWKEITHVATELAIKSGKLEKGLHLSDKWIRLFRRRWPQVWRAVNSTPRSAKHEEKGDSESITVKMESDSVARVSTESGDEYEEMEDEESSSPDEKQRERTPSPGPADPKDFTPSPDGKYDPEQQGMARYFSELHMLFTRYNLTDRPELVYCVDEGTISYESGMPKAKPLKSFQAGLSRSELGVISVIGCGNAVGMPVPPFFIYPNLLTDDLLKGKYPGTQAVASEDGLSSFDIFKHYIEKHFMNYAIMRKDSHTLLLYNGNRTQVTPTMIEWAKKKGVLLYVLPPESSYMSAETGCFYHFRDIFSKECDLYREIGKVKRIQVKDICRIACESYHQAFCARNLVTKFELLGIHPYNPPAMLNSDLRLRLLTNKQIDRGFRKRKRGMKDKCVQVDDKKPMDEEDSEEESDDEHETTTDVLRRLKVQKMLQERKYDIVQDYRTGNDSDAQEEEYISEYEEDDAPVSEQIEEVQTSDGTTTVVFRPNQGPLIVPHKILPGNTEQLVAMAPKTTHMLDGIVHILLPPGQDTMTVASEQVVE